MQDLRTLRLAYRPVTAEALDKYVALLRAEQAGSSAAAALSQSGLEPDDAGRLAAAVNGFCRPRLLKRALERARPADSEKRRKRDERLGAPIDDTEVVERYGADSLKVLLAREDELVALRERAKA